MRLAAERISTPWNRKFEAACAKSTGRVGSSSTSRKGAGGREERGRGQKTEQEGERGKKHEAAGGGRQGNCRPRETLKRH